MAKEKEALQVVMEEKADADNNILGIKRYILKMLGDLGQKGDRRVGTSPEPTLHNLTKLTSFLLDAYHQTEREESANETPAV